MPVSKWRSIADDLSRKIEGGEIARGAQLPTELELQADYNASRNTVRDAIKWLIQRQLVETYPGRGTFVSAEIIPFTIPLSPHALGFGGEGGAYIAAARVQNRRTSMDDPRVEIRMAGGVMARQLRLEEGTRVVSRHQQRYVDDRPWSLQTTSFPMEFVDRGADRLVDATPIEGGVVKYIEEELGLTQVGYQDIIAVRPPDQQEAQFFRLADSASVSLIELSRTAYDVGGEPIRFTVTLYPADRNTLYYNLGDVPEDVTEIPALR